MIQDNLIIMKKSLPKSKQNVIFQAIKESSPFKPYPKASNLIYCQYKDTKVNLSKHYHQSKQSINDKNNQSKQRLKKVTFIQTLNQINPQILRKQQYQSKIAQNYKKDKKEKQALKVNKSIQQLKRKVDQLVDTFTIRDIQNNNASILLNKLSNTNSFYIDRKVQVIDFKNQKSNIINQNQQNGIERLKRYRHIQETKISSNLFKKYLLQERQSNLKRQKLSEKSFSINKSKNIMSTKSPQRQNSHVLKKDQQFFTHVRSFSQKNIRTGTNNSRIVSKPQRQIKSKSQILNKQSRQQKKQLKRTKSLLSSTTSSLRGIHQSLQNNSVSVTSERSHYKNRWRHENEIEILRHKLLGY